MTLAGLSPAGVLIVRAGEAKVLRVALMQADGVTPQDLAGRSFAMIIRRSTGLTPLLQFYAELSGDGLYATIAIAANKATEIYSTGASQALSYDIVELSGGASVSRWTERVKVEPAPALPDMTPVWVDLPYSQALISPDAIVVTEKGGRGASASEELHEALIIPEPTVEAMDARYAGIGATAGAEAGRAAAIEASFGIGYTFPLTKIIGITAVTVLASDPNRKRLTLTNRSSFTKMVVSLRDGLEPSTFDRDCVILNPGETRSWEGYDCPPDEIRAMSLGGTATLFATILNTSGYDPSTAGVLSRFDVQPTSERLEAINRYYAAVNAARVMEVMDIFHPLAAADAQAAGVNWAGTGQIVPHSNGASAAPTFVPDRYYQGTGGYLDTGRSIPSINYLLDDACMMLWLFDTAVDNSRFTMGFGSGAMQPNRSTTNGGTVWVKPNSSTNYVVTVNGLGGFFAWTRDNPYTFTVYRYDPASQTMFSVETPGASESLITRNLFGLANNGATGPGAGVTHQLGFMAAGASITAGQIEATAKATHRYFQDVGAIA